MAVHDLRLGNSSSQDWARPLSFPKAKWLLKGELVSRAVEAPMFSLSARCLTSAHRPVSTRQMLASLKKRKKHSWPN